jgi:hypothetical protein
MSCSRENAKVVEAALAYDIVETDQHIDVRGRASVVASDRAEYRQRCHSGLAKFGFVGP